MIIIESISKIKAESTRFGIPAGCSMAKQGLQLLSHRGVCLSLCKVKKKKNVKTWLELRQGRKIQVKVTMTMVDNDDTVVVAMLVSAQGLSGLKSLVAYGTFVCLSDRV